MTTNDSVVQSLERGLAVIRSFGAERAQQTLSDVAAETGLTRATARRVLLTLVELGYARSDGRQFSLTPAVLSLGYSYLSALSLPELVHPHLERLARTSGHSASLSVLSGDEVVYVARVAANRLVSVRITIGTRLPAVATSMGRVLLAALPDDERDALLGAADLRAFTAATITDPVEVRAAIAAARSAGWAVVEEELERGLRSAAAPIRQRGRVVGAINVAGAVTFARADFDTAVVSQLRETAERVSADLDHAPPIEPGLP